MKHTLGLFDENGETLDFVPLRRRNKPVVKILFVRMLEVNGLPRKTVIDKGVANTEGLKAVNKMLKSLGCRIPIEMVKRRYLNNSVEQDHRFIKRCMRPKRFALVHLSWTISVFMVLMLAVASLINLNRVAKFARQL
nr:DDE-type integrase/transposase/recombinase [Ruegeria sp. HKCCD4884]